MKNAAMFFSFLLVLWGGCSGNEGSLKVLSDPGHVRQVYDTGQPAKEEEQKKTFRKEVSGLIYELRERPAVLLAMDELRRSGGDSALLVSEYSKLRYFTFKIIPATHGVDLLHAGVSNHTLYEERLRYCSFSLSEDIELSASGVTSPCTLFHFERDYGLNGALTFNIGFEKLESSTGQTFIYNDRLFNKGPVKISLL